MLMETSFAVSFLSLASSGIPQITNKQTSKKCEIRDIDIYIFLQAVVYFQSKIYLFIFVKFVQSKALTKIYFDNVSFNKCMALFIYLFTMLYGTNGVIIACLKWKKPDNKQLFSRCLTDKHRSLQSAAFRQHFL